MQKCGQQTIFIILQALPVMFSQGQVPKQETSNKSVLCVGDHRTNLEEAEFASSKRLLSVIPVDHFLGTLVHTHPFSLQHHSI